MRDIRSAHVRGEYHRLLVALLLREMARQSITQESMAAAVRMHQTTVGDILKSGTGTFDLDEADALLRHVGSSLLAFIGDPAHAVTPPPERRSKIASKLRDMLLEMGDTELALVLDAAKSVRKVLRAKKQSKRRRGAVPARVVRKTGETR